MKKNIAIVMGGYSSEVNISLKSGNVVYKHLDREKYMPFRVHILKEKWVALDDANNEYPIDKNDFSFLMDVKLIKFDVVFNAIHGNPGENGKIQALLDMQNIPYVNAGPLASSLSFDKWYCNQFLSKFGVPVANSLFLRNRFDIQEQEIIDKLGLPLFVKPSDSGSSYGISKVNLPEELGKALDAAFKEGRTVVIESFLKGTEVTCGVYRRKTGIHALPLTEICSENDFFDYEAKYLGKSQEITPARVNDSIREKVQETAKMIYDLMQLRSIARIDFMVVDDVPHVIEVNTTPGFSPASIVPQMIKCDGNTIRNFWTEILEVEL